MMAISRYVAQANDDLRPFVWTKDPDETLTPDRTVTDGGYPRRMNITLDWEMS